MVDRNVSKIRVGRSGHPGVSPVGLPRPPQPLPHTQHPRVDGRRKPSASLRNEGNWTTNEWTSTPDRPDCRHPGGGPTRKPTRRDRVDTTNRHDRADPAPPRQDCERQQNVGKRGHSFPNTGPGRVPSPILLGFELGSRGNGTTVGDDHHRKGYSLRVRPSCSGRQGTETYPTPPPETSRGGDGRTVRLGTDQKDSLCRTVTLDHTLHVERVRSSPFTSSERPCPTGFKNVKTLVKRVFSGHLNSSPFVGRIPRLPGNRGVGIDLRRQSDGQWVPTQDR